MNIVETIDTRIGTRNQHSIGHGNTLPYLAYPFGMNHFVMQTRLGESRFFHPDDYGNYGVRLTHQPSPWMGDFCQVLYNQILLSEEEYQALINNPNSSKFYQATYSSYRPDEAEFHPHYLSYQRLRDGLTHEWVPTKWGARWRCKQSRKMEGHCLLIVTLEKDGQVVLDPSQGAIQIATRQMSGSKYHKTTQYSQLYLPKQVKQVLTIEDDQLNYKHVLFEWVEGWTQVDLHLVTSYISFEQVNNNFQMESCLYLEEWDQAKTKVANDWNDYLSKIEIVTKDTSQRTMFYHCLYRTATFPQRAYEYQENQPVHFSFYTGKVQPGYYYTNNGYWDTFRTNYPLYTLIVPELVNRFIEGIAHIAEEDTYLPKWLSPDERGLMPGTLVDGVIADAIVKGMVSEPVSHQLLEAMIYSANHEGNDPTEGREGVNDYLTLGYLPCEYHESVNKTLDFAYSDYCISQVAKYLGKHEIASEYNKRSLNYRNLFNPWTGLMTPKNNKGEFIESEPSYRWGQHYTEGSAWQNSLAVYHNLADLVDLHGGDQAFAMFLERLVNQDPLYHVGGYGYEIHEMTEMARVDFGQLALSNQPSFHIPYLYLYAGYPHHSHQLVKNLAKNCFHPTFDGFIGDEDNGSLSAWYVLSTIGLYPVTPASGEWTLGICLVDRAIIHHGKGKLEINSNTKQKEYLQVVRQRMIDQEIYHHHSISHHDLLAISTIEQWLGAIPSLMPIDKELRPYSMSQR